MNLFKKLLPDVVVIVLFALYFRLRISILR